MDMRFIGSKRIVTADKLAKVLLEKRPSIADGVEYITRRYQSKFSLDKILDELYNEAEARYQDLLLKLTYDDISYLLKFLNERKRSFDIPMININFYQYETVKHFIKKIDGYKVISNCYGLGKDRNAYFMSVVPLDYIVLKHGLTIDFMFPFSVSKELEEVDFLFSVLDVFGKKYDTNKKLTSFFEEDKQRQQDDQLKEKKEVSYKTEYHVISYILDCKARKIELPIGKKKQIENDAKNRIKYEGSENTFYRNFNNHANHEINKTYLIDLIGSDWRDVVLNLSNDKDTLRNYLERHFV